MPLCRLGCNDGYVLFQYLENTRLYRPMSSFKYRYHGLIPPLVRN